jgi:hypothetical protein
MTQPIFSRRQMESFTPPGTERSYSIAPLTFRERQAFRADLAREAGVYPGRALLLDALRAAVQEVSPDNAASLLTEIEAAEATPDDPAAHARLQAIEAACATVPTYAALLAARQHYLGMMPWVAARHALRGWDGPGLPPFRRERNLVPADLLDLLPDAELEAIGWQASALMQPDAAALGNSGAPSPLPETPAPMTAG